MENKAVEQTVSSLKKKTYNKFKVFIKSFPSGGDNNTVFHGAFMALCNKTAWCHFLSWTPEVLLHCRSFYILQRDKKWFKAKFTSDENVNLCRNVPGYFTFDTNGKWFLFKDRNIYILHISKKVNK